MGQNLNLDNCTNKQEAVLAAHIEELEETKGRSSRRRSLGDEPGPLEDEVLIPHFAEILPEPSTYSQLEWERELYKK